MKEFTEDEALALYRTGWWHHMEDEEIALFQLQQDRLCMDFSDYHHAVENALGRPVWTHEFARPKDLLAELQGKVPKRTMRDVLDVLHEIAPNAKIITVKEE